MNTKQVIVMRYKYPDGKGGTTGVRAGKLIAQACHASMAFITKRVFEDHYGDPYFSDAEMNWFQTSFAKVCVRVDSEEELIDVYNKSKEAGLEVHLITDSGRTEFNEPTKTCLAIGPDLVEKIDPITGHLKLL